jgi:hypothetical protein
MLPPPSRAPLTVEELWIGQHEGDGTEADDEGQHVEVADPGRRPEHRLARLLGVGHREEAHQDVRQPGGAEHQRHAEADGRDRILDEAARAHDRDALLDGLLGRHAAGAGQSGLHLDCLGEHRLRAEAEVPQHHQRHEGRAGEQQPGLDDLHPGGGGHATEQHVDHHQRADDDHGDPVLETEQQLDQLAGADHLGDEVEGTTTSVPDAAKTRIGVWSEAEGGDVGEGELAEVAQAFGEQEGHDRPADEKADRVDQAVEAAHHHRGRDAEERRRRHVVAGDRQAVLEAGDAAAGGVEVGGRLGAAGRPLGDEERADDERREHADRGPVGRLLLGLAEIGAGLPGRARRRRARRRPRGRP